MFEDTSAANIRRALGIDDAETGQCIFYIIVFRELLPITKLSGNAVHGGKLLSVRRLPSIS
jgi:hypothetical protein